MSSSREAILFEDYILYPLAVCQHTPCVVPRFVDLYIDGLEKTSPSVIVFTRKLP